MPQLTQTSWGAVLTGGGAGGARQGWEEKGTETKARAEAYRPSPGPTRALVPVERDGGGAPDCCHSVASAARRLM